MSTPAENKALVERFWQDLYEHEFDKCGAYFADDGFYVDVPVMGPDEDQGATGPAEIAARLRLGLEPIDKNVHHLKTMVAEGDVVVTEHVEEWFWKTGEHVALPFVSMMELRDGKIVRWWDYWNLATLMDGAPAWWIEDIAKGYR